MGGAKKPTTGGKNKQSAGGKESKKGKKDKGSESGPRRAEIIVRVNDGQALKIIKSSKVITMQELARQLGVKISATNAFLKRLVSDGSVNIVGGYAGHYLYQDAEVTKAMAKEAAEKAAKEAAAKEAAEKAAKEEAAAAAAAKEAAEKAAKEEAAAKAEENNNNEKSAKPDINSEDAVASGHATAKQEPAAKNATKKDDTDSSTDTKGAGAATPSPAGQS